MELGADYSYARPGGAALKAAGVSYAGRYLADDDRGITAAEYQDLLAYGIGVWLIREGRANGMLGGFNQGSADAQIAVQQIALVGLPPGSVVFATADFDVETDAQFAALDDYLRGFASVLGVARVGIYGGLHYLNHAYQAGLATHFWQAGATSWDHGEQPLMPLAFHQTTLTPPVPGTDHNYVLDTTATAGGSASLIRTDDDEMLSQEAQDFITNAIDARVTASEQRNRRESRARVYQRHELPGAPLWVAGPTFVPRAVAADVPELHDQNCLKGDTLLVDAGDFARPQQISEIAWGLLIQEHENFRNAIAEAVYARFQPQTRAV